MSAPTSTTDGLTGGAVLIVDDDLVLRTMLQSVVSGGLRHIELVHDGESAIRRIARGDIDLVVLDLGLPDVSGMQVLKQARLDSPETEIVVVTGSEDVGDAVDALKAGAFDYFTKPIHPVKLANAAERALQARALKSSSNIARAVHSVGSAPSLKQLPARLVSAAVAVTRASGGVLYEAVGEGLDIMRQMGRVPTDHLEPAALAVAQRGQPITLRGDPNEEVPTVNTPRRARGLLKRRRGAPKEEVPVLPHAKPTHGPALLMPLMVGPRVLGVVGVVRSVGSGRFTPQDAERLGILAAEGGLAMDRSILLAKLRDRVEELEHARSQLTATERSQGLGQIASSYADEIRRPLADLDHELQACVDALAPLGEQGEVARAALGSAVGHAGRIRAVAGDLELIGDGLEDTEIAVDRLVGLALRIAGKSGVQVDLRLDDISVVGNVASLAHALYQLIDNAVLAAEETGGKVMISAGANNSKAEIVVLDHGRGMSPAELESAFEPFFSTRTGAAGMGLTMARRVVGDGGGLLRLESRVGEGTRAVLSLPLAGA